MSISCVVAAGFGLVSLPLATKLSTRRAASTPDALTI